MGRKKQATVTQSKPRRSPRDLNTKNTKDEKELNAQETTAKKCIRQSSTKSEKTSLSHFKKVDQDISFKINRKCTKEDVHNTSVLFNTSYRQFANSSFSTPSNGDCPKSVDFYNFEEDDDFLPIRLNLSPIKADEKTPGRSRSKSTKTSGVKRSINQRKDEESSAAKRKRMEKIKNAKNKKSTPITSSVNKSSKTKKTPTNKETEDSGVFMTPASFYGNNDMPESAEATPASDSAKMPLQDKENQTTCAEADQALPKKKRAKRSPAMVDSPMLSPVQKVSSPGIQGALVTSQCDMFEDLAHCSVNELLPSANTDADLMYTDNVALVLDPIATFETSVTSGQQRTQENSDEVNEDEPYTTLNISKTYSGLGFGYFDRSVEKKKKQKKTKKAQRMSVSRYDAVASQMNQEFEDLENFEFSLE